VTLPSPKQLLDQFGLSPKNSFGQNFLSDPRLAEKIALLCGEGGSRHILELGAGLGALTDQLLSRGNSVVAVERDRDLVPALQTIFSNEIETGQLRLIEGDAKTVDFRKEFESGPSGAAAVIAGNLPYQITGPLLEKTVLAGRFIERAVYLVQKEVAQRLGAEPNTKEYGALSIFVQAQFAVQKSLVLKPGAFYPSPRVESQVVVLVPHAAPVAEETPIFRKVVKAAFAARRKTLRNAWKGLLATDDLAGVAAASGVSLDARGETLSVSQFAEVARLVAERESQG
jgi:16S rRNA (adenine1518-N6/adenine1519-N6)-dimethyltransferase